MSTRHRLAGLSRGSPRQPPTTFGPQGPQGDEGAQGPQGEPGEAGGADELIIHAAASSHDLDGWRVVGSVTLDPADFTYVTSELEVHVSVADAAHAGEVRLWNLTTATQIGATISSTATVTEVQSTVVNLTAGVNTYEVQIRNVDNGYLTDCPRSALRFS